MTLEERVNEYVQRYDEYDRGNCRDVAERAYLQGAKDQQQYVIDKLCDYMKKFNQGMAVQVDIESWRMFIEQAIEEQQ